MARFQTNSIDICLAWLIRLDLRYLPTGRTGHPDFVARSRRAPASELTDHETWCRSWIDAFENPRGVVAHRGE